MLIAVAVIGLGILAATLLPMLASAPPDDVHEIRLVVRAMNFYVEGESQPNPTLTVRAGEQVRLVLKNDDPGMSHDFVVKEWDVATKTLEDRGQEDTITFKAPSSPGEMVYQCTPHAQLMRGTIRVQ
jgi:plastocyanin